jgi:hypothetical protein
MLENFQLAAIVRGTPPRLLRIPLHQGLQQTLANSWGEQLERFQEDAEEVEFQPGYILEEHERYALKSFDLPDWLDKDGGSVANLDPISEHENLIESTRGIVAFARDEGDEVVLFQNFSRSHVIRPGRFLFLQNDTYETAERPGLTLDQKLSAVYVPDMRLLLFQNFRTTNTFLPLEEFYEEASEEEIEEVLNHARLAAEDADALVAGANQWFRKRFAMLRDSGILDKYTAKQIKAHAKGYGMDIELKGNKIVFPAAKGEAKRLLQFLNEELFKGAITETLYETNSKRTAG